MNNFFFALSPGPSTRDKIITFREQLNLSGHKVKDENLHMTLLFLGKINRQQQQAVISKAQGISWQTFNVLLDHSGSFHKNIIWSGPELIPASLVMLHRELVTAARESEIKLQTQQYIPHVTLARQSSIQNKVNMMPVKWHISSFLLLESVNTAQGVYYHRVEKIFCQEEK